MEDFESRLNLVEEKIVGIKERLEHLVGITLNLQSTVIIILAGGSLMGAVLLFVLARATGL